MVRMRRIVVMTNTFDCFLMMYNVGEVWGKSLFADLNVLMPVVWFLYFVDSMGLSVCMTRDLSI